MKRLALSWLLLLLAWLAAVPGFAQLPKLDALLQDLSDKSQFYGSVLVRRGGAKVFEGAYGYFDDTATSRTAPDSVYYLNDSSATFCATLVMMAVDKGLLALDAPLDTYLPEFKGKPSPRLRDLLSQSSGLVTDFLWKLPKPCGLPDWAANAAKAGPMFAAGTQFSPGSCDFNLLGYALERAAGKPYTALLSEWILAPLGLKDTGMGLYPGEPKRLPLVGSQKDVEWDFSRVKDGCAPAWGMYSTVADLATFHEALAAGRLASKASYQLMRTGLFPDTRWTKGKGKVGLGLFLAPSTAVFDQGRWQSSSSIYNGHHSLALLDPRYDLTIILLANKWQPRSEVQALETVAPVVYADLGLAE